MTHRSRSSLSKHWISLALGIVLALVWSSAAFADFVRPQGATPKTDALVVSYQPCGTSTPTVHGGPDSSPLTGTSSCQPVQSSPFLTAGTLGVNGEPARFRGRVRQDVTLSPPDIKLTASMTDVRCARPIALNPVLCTPNGPGPPAYIGMTDMVVPIDVTDNCNYVVGSGGGPCPAPPTSGTLASTIALDFPMPCAVPSVTGIGSTCSVTTSWNARFPGIVPPQSPPDNGSRMNIGIGQVRVTDGSDNGKPNPNNATFAISGLFSP